MIKYKPKSVNVHETGEDYRIILEYKKPLFKNIDIFMGELRGQCLRESVIRQKDNKTVVEIRTLPKNTGFDYVKVYQQDPQTLITHELYDNLTLYDKINKIKKIYNEGTKEEMILFLENIRDKEAKEVLKIIIKDLYDNYK